MYLEFAQELSNHALVFNIFNAYQRCVGQGIYVNKKVRIVEKEEGCLTNYENADKIKKYIRDFVEKVR